MYAVKGNSWRAIDSESDLLNGEVAMETPPDVVEEPQPPTLEERLAAAELLIAMLLEA